MDSGKIQVRGIQDLQKALRQIDRDLPKELAAGLAEAAEIVAKTARPKVPTRTGKAAGSITVRKQQRGASLAVGGNRAPHFPWLDFGGRVGPKKSVARPFIKSGRYVYPALAEKNTEVKAKVDEVLERMARKAGFEQEGKGF